mgnify:CR=1 FL=1
MKEIISEFIGTFILVLFGTGAVAVSAIAPELNVLAIALAFGGAVMLVIDVFGDISGAHINPAVTIAFWVSGKFDKKQVLPYVVAQIMGGLLASGVLYYSLLGADPNIGVTQPLVIQANEYVGLTFLLEFLLTFVLMLVILIVATGSKEKGLKAGITIGSTVFLEALVFGPVTGASMNPARSIAPNIISGNIQHLWMYILAPILGALLAVVSCKLVKDENCCDEEC